VVKRLLVGGLVVVLVVGCAGFFWVRSVLAGDGVRVALAGQLSKAIGQPVTIAGVSATAYPRVTVNLHDVRIGEPARVQVAELHVGTDFRALLSRRIEHATLRLAGAHLELPLPTFHTGDRSDAGAAQPSTTSSPVELVSIDEVVLSDVQVVSGGRTLRGDVAVVPLGSGFQIRKLELHADDTTITATGTITDLSGPIGELNVKATTLSFDRLMAFVTAFSGGAGLASTPDRQQEPAHTPPAERAEAPSRMHLTVSLDAGRATMGTLAMEKLTGRMSLTAHGVTLDPVGFGVFGGRYDGALTLTPGRGTPGLTARAKLTGVDVAAATAFAGTPNTVTGRLSGRLDVAASGSDAAAVINSARGSARVDIVDGVVRNLGLLHSVVVATSMRADATSHLAEGSKDEPFSKLGATLLIGNGAVTTDDLRFEATDLTLTAGGAVQLRAAAVNLKGRVQLSEALTEQAGRDLVRYTQEQGRVTLPATVSGPSDALRVNIDVGDVAIRALRNAATDRAQELLKRNGLTGLLKR
jgi:uncharacterized protein involved in outer membrane biogenesis